MLKKILFVSVLLQTLVMIAQVKISGVVINQDIQRPISGVRISFSNHPQAEILTNTDGTFHLESNTTNDSLVIIALGYKKKIIPLHSQEDSNIIVKFSSNDLEKDSPVHPLVQEYVKVTGTLKDLENQEPITNARIFFKDSHVQTYSDSNGFFEIINRKFSDSIFIDANKYPIKSVPLSKGDNLNLEINFSNSNSNPNSEYIVSNETNLKEKIDHDSLIIHTDSISYYKANGHLYNMDKNEPIADATIFFEGTQNFTNSDENGYFEIQDDSNVNRLAIYTNDFDVKYVTLDKGNNSNLIVEFSNKIEEKEKREVIKSDKLEGVVVKGFPPKRIPKKENPAYRIMQEVWKRKKTNGLKNFNNYQYNEYEKIEFDLNNIDSAFISKKIFKKLDITVQDIDTSAFLGKTYLPVFLNESITQVVGENKPSKREKSFLRGNRSVGVPSDNDIIANTVKNLYKDVNIYDNVLNFFNKGFTSPVATIGFSVYDYMLVDTVMVDSVKCYYLKYKPRRANELTFKGDLYITYDTYAVKHATLQAASGINVNFVKDIYMELDYKNVNDSVFLPLKYYTNLDMSLITKKDKSKGMFAKRTLIYDNYLFDEPSSKIDTLLDEQWEPISGGAYKQNDQFWEEHRLEKLTDDDLKANEVITKVSKTKLYRDITNLVQILSSGYVNVGKAIDIGNLYQFIGYNDVEGLRLRLGARTYFTPNDMWRLEGYTAYGFKDEQVKYGAEGRLMFNKFNRFTIGLGTKRDISQLGVSLTEGESIMSRSFASSSIISRGSNEFLSSVNKTNAFVSIEPWKNVQLRLDGTYQFIKSANPEKFDIGYYDKFGNIKQDLYDTHLTFSVEARPGAKYSRYGLDRFEHTTLAPTFILKYVRGIKGAFNSGFNYDKVQFMYSQPILWGPIGRTDITTEFGKTFNKLPVSLLGVIPGNQSYGIIPNTFALLNYYDFVTDVYATMHLEHHFNGRIFSYIPLLKKLQLREVLIFRGAWGDISDGSKSMNASNIEYVAPNKDIYYEYGFGIENIGFGNLRIFRVDFNWRGNYLDIKKVNKFGIKFGMQYSF
ncbi:carboxypeptidase-like regulatory domain-containing protein [Apibacter muscae]|uniref:Carboxypeptidase-like regulatory domain-containing protein n=1 Tax=Apibacter muscae TaxID=2509004 RepID=A0A563DBN7_9FLAO|nr:DUF5686 family protein [Apibacter muscae]TWP27343.1 carboxypeptidase-like regulatory domain-containing protein [Apibacter muscae]TWP28563.1 carboxypeptidase-like regulatory domain-containing protein [Apibacter muscae]